MTIRIKLGADYEEKRFLAGVLMYHLSQLLERNLRDHAMNKMKLAGDRDFGYDEQEIKEDKEKMARLRKLRLKAVAMLGGPSGQDYLSAEDLEEVCGALGSFDFVRDVMGA